MKICPVREKIRLLCELSLHEMKMSEAGSKAGLAWSFGEPVLLFAVLWAVFRFCVRAGDIRGVPYGDWFLAGYLPWQLVSRTVCLSTGIIRKHRALLRQIRFPVAILPLVPAVTSLWIHIILLLLFTGHMSPKRGTTAGTGGTVLLTAMALLVILSCGLAYLVSTVCVLRPSACSVTSVLLQIWFWATPLAWQEENVGRAGSGTLYGMLLSLNPLRSMTGSYRSVLLGFRDSGSLKPAAVISLCVLSVGIFTYFCHEGKIADAV